MVWKKRLRSSQYTFNSEKVFLVATQPSKSIYSYLQTTKLGLTQGEVQERHINGKTNCSTFTKHFVPNLILLTQNKMCILLRWFHLFSSFVYLCISLA